MTEPNNPYRTRLEARIAEQRASITPALRLQALEGVIGRSARDLDYAQREALEKVFADTCQRNPEIAEWAAQYEPPAPETNANIAKGNIASTETELAMHHRLQRESGERPGPVFPLERTLPAPQPETPPTAVPSPATSHGGSAPGCQLQLDNRPPGMPPPGTMIDYSGRPPRPVPPPELTPERYGLKRVTRGESNTGWMWNR